MCNDKSPGPDGFPADFFKHYRHLVGNSVCLTIKAFFHSGHLNTEFNNNFIALLPKVDTPMNINHYRPISLCNTILKIITKPIATRLKLIMHKLIHPLQGAFVEGRVIQNNTLLAHEVFHSFHKKSIRKVGWVSNWIWKRSLICLNGISFITPLRNLVFRPGGSLG